MTVGIHAFFLTAHSSTVGNFDVQHSEPKGNMSRTLLAHKMTTDSKQDHSGAAQYVIWSHGQCTIKGQLMDGCSVKVSSAVGCGSGSNPPNYRV
jgi:hypothetical protein